MGPEDGMTVPGELMLCFETMIHLEGKVHFKTKGILKDIQDYYGIKNDSAGLVQTAFVLSYMIFAPLFGYLGDRYSRRWIMAAGVFLWSLTTLFGSFMNTFGWFVVFRSMVGIGEASYSTIAPTIISDYFIGDVRSKMLALFYFAIPVGSGLGYIVGSETAKAAGQWQWALRVTPALGVAAVILIIFVLSDPERGQSECSGHMEATPWLEDIKDIVQNRSFMFSTAGFTCVAFVAGALAWWGPSFIEMGIKLQDNGSADSDSVAYKFGIISMVSGLLGVPFGSFLAQKLRHKYHRIDAHICAVGLLVSSPLVFLACITARYSATLCYTLVFFAEFFLNLTWSIVADVLLYVVLPTRRSTAEGFQLLVSHALDITYTDCSNNQATVESLKDNQHTFAVHLNLYIHVKIIDMNCCINKKAWCFSSEGMINVGQDEIVILLEFIDEESSVPKDIFYHINNIYADAVKGTSIKEMGLSLHNSANFLDSKNHAGFVYIHPTFQCLENIIKPKDPYLIGILIHRWETPWAKLFPLRLILRLGAEYRYYPSPIISTRHRDSVFVEIGHTIINLLADFRNFSYTLPQIRGLTIHMEDKNTTVTIPVNRYDQVIKSLNNTSDHILAFAGVFSQQADSHLVCIQDTQSNENCYSTHAINIHNKPRKVTGASFIVFNGALKSSSGLKAKSNIVEDGLMIQVMPEHMQQIRDKLRAMKNHTIPCGCVNADTDETVNIVWGENDVNFNIGITSAIDGLSLSGIPSIRVHNGKNHVCVNGNRIIRWTEVFIIQNGEESPKNQDPVDVSRISENIAKATCDALVKYLDLLLTNNFQKLGIRVTLQEDDVSYFAGSNGTKLPPIYMKSLDNELVPVLHRITSNDLRENAIVLELIFRILNV
ncbi:hypothetical protein JTB14_014363 [Gonioctena quinquepunctata]|nr:hypothetical protein JTB14_014363 [Gonioctena quinquepunctata]